MFVRGASACKCPSFFVNIKKTLETKGRNQQMYAVSFGQENITCNHEGYQACCMLLHELGLGGTHHPRKVVVSNIFLFLPLPG